MEIKTCSWDNGNLVVNSKFANLLKSNNITSASDLWNLESQNIKATVPHRSTAKVLLQPETGEQPVETFIKRYEPATIKEILKGYLSLKKQAHFDALHEWEAIIACHRHGIPTMEPIAAARLGKHTCNLTLGIKDYVRASELLASRDTTVPRERKQLIAKIANLVGRMHQCGFAHQDMYLVHFFVKRSSSGTSIYIIDLQRMIMQKKLASRWRVKDLAQLLFSARPFLSDREILQFISIYSKISAFSLTNHKRVLKGVHRKAAKIEKHHNRRYAKKHSLNTGTNQFL